jgi:membrane-bound lytic murein transglycosylase B
MIIVRPRRTGLSRRVAIAALAVAAMAVPASVAAADSGKGSPSLVGGKTSLGKAHSAIATQAPADPSAPQVDTASAQTSTTADPKAAGLPASGKAVTGDDAIPATVLAAYRKAAAALAVTKTSCHLTWPLLAGIGKVETDHGRTWGSKARLTAAGEVVPTILGPVLNGRNGTGKLLDTDGGALDHDRQYDRAVGPMQFVPATWQEFGRDGNGDGVSNPNNIWDASLGAANYLCAGDRNLAVAADRRAAILAYNPSSAYVRSVLAWAAAYQHASVNGPALGTVPNPLVLGAGGQAGDDPYGDGETADDSSSFEDPGSLGAIFGSVPESGSGAIVVQAGRPSGGVTQPKPATSSRPSKPAKPPVPATKPKPAVKPTPACVDPAIALVSKAVITAAAVDLDHDGKNDVLRVTTTVTAAKAGEYVFGVRLQDANQYGITTVLHTMQIKAGKQTLTEDLSGQAIGDAGAAGPATVRLAVRRVDAPTTCAVVLAAKASAGKIDPSTYDGWTVDLARLRSRLADDIKAGLVTGTAVKMLPAALASSDPDLEVFLADLRQAQTVVPAEHARLASLAQRLIDQAAQTPAQTPAPTPSETPSPTASATASASASPSPTPGPSLTPTPAPTPTP